MQQWNNESAWTDPTGTRRRLQGLTAAGWTTADVARHMGITKSAVAALRCTPQTRVLTSTATHVAAVYEQLWWRTPPSRTATRSERYAERHGWPAPWQWDAVDIDAPAAQPLVGSSSIDAIAVAEAIAGRPVALTCAERNAAIEAMRRNGIPPPEIAARTGLSTRTVERRVRHRAAA